jgi:hypothetical protein
VGGDRAGVAGRSGYAGLPPRDGEGDHPQDGGGDSPHTRRLDENPLRQPCGLPPPRPGEDFHRHWAGKGPLPDDGADIDGRPCAICAQAIAPADLVRLRLQRPAGTVKKPEFDEQSLPFHFECLAAVSSSRLF